MVAPTPKKQAAVNKTSKVKVGDALADVIAAHNALAAKFNAVLAKLDADAGVTDTNYAATQAVAGGTLTVPSLETR
jgi:histidinol phosphatase-like enzyme